MSTPTSKLGLPKPAGNELNNRAGYNAVLDQIDAAAMKDIFYCKTAVYNSGTSKIDVTIGPGVISFLQIVVNKTVDTVYSISSPAINTSYYVYLSSAGAFSSNTTGAEVDGAVMLWKISTGAALTAISTLDLRGIVNGSAQMVKDLLDSYQSTNDSAVALKAPLASPVLTGTPSAPTAAANTNTTQLATTAFVEAARVILAAADAAKAPLASPALTGTPTAPTASLGTNTTQLATSAFVQAAIANLISSAPGALDTLNELAAALGNDPNFATTITNALALKAPLASPSLSGIPTAPTATALTNTTQLATTAFVDAVRIILVAADALKAPLASPIFTGNPTAPTPAYGDNDTSIATTAFARANFSFMSNADTMYYVRTDGSDANTGLTNTAGGAFLTITKAISMLPSALQHLMTVSVLPGTYAETVLIKGFSGGGSLSIKSTMPGTVFTVNNMIILSNACRISPTDVQVTSVNATYAGKSFYVQDCLSVIVNHLVNTFASGTDDGFYAQTSNVYLAGSVLSNKGNGIESVFYSNVYSVGNTGTGNTVGLNSGASSKIGKNGTQPTGATPEVTSSGGEIIGDAGVINPWGDNTYLQRSHMRAYMASGPQTIANSTWTKLNYDGEWADNLSEYDTTLKRFTAKTVGGYLVQVSALLQSMITGGDTYISIYVNGTTTFTTYSVCTIANGSVHTSLSKIMQLGVGDYIEIYMLQNNSGSKIIQNTGDYTNLMITRVA